MKYLICSLLAGLSLSNVTFADRGYDHSPQRWHAGEREYLEYRIDQRVEGRNRVHLTEIFSLDRRQAGKHLDRIEVVGRDRNRYYETSSTLELVNEYAESFGRETLRGAELATFRPTHRHLGQAGTHYDLIVDGDIDLEKIVVVLSDRCDQVPPAEPPYAPPRRDYFSLNATVEGRVITLNGRGREEAFYDCVNQISDRRMGRIDDVSANGQRFRNRPSYWSTETVCGFLALMSQPEDGGRYQTVERVLLAYVNESTPIMIYDNRPGSIADVYADLDALLPRIVSSSGASKIQLWGSYPEEPRWGKWSYSEIQQKLRSAIRR